MKLNNVMVDLAELWANSTHVVDFIPKIVTSVDANLELICKKYVENGLSLNQIAAEFGVTRQCISKHLKAAKIVLEPTRYCEQKNYRRPNPPYGFRVHKGKLLEYAKEKRIAALKLRST